MINVYKSTHFVTIKILLMLNCTYIIAVLLYFYQYIVAGENYIIIVAGANGTLQKEDVKRANSLLFNETGVVLFQFETPLETTKYLLDELTRANSKCK